MFFPIRDDIPHRKPPVTNYLLIAANIVVFVLQVKSGPAAYQYAAVPSQVVHGHQLYTVLTSMFMHGGIAHILSNMWFLWIFGDNVEDAFGHLGYLAVYIAAGICGATLQILTTPGSETPMLGSSGAISGVMGAYLVLYPRARVLTLWPIFLLSFFNIPAVIYLLLWIGIQVLFGLATPQSGGGTAFFAHIGGFAFGFMLGFIARILGRRPQVSYRIR